LFHAEFFRASQLNPPDKTVAVLPVSDASETKDQGYKLAVRPSAQEQPVNGTYDFYLQRLFTDVTHPISSTGISVPLQNPSNPFTVPDYTFSGGFDQRRADTRVNATPPETGVATSVRYRATEAGPRTNKITAEATVAPAEAGVTTSVRDRASEAGPRTNKLKAEVTPAPPGTGIATTVRYRASETGLRTNKVTADAPASFQGFVKDAKGEPIKGADVRIESRDGKQLFSTATTDPKGRYISQGMQPGVYRITLLVNGAVKASILNTRTKVDQPTQLNFDFKRTSPAANIAKGGKHMVWVPARTGSHIGGNWIEVDDEGNPHFDSNIQTYNVGH